MGACCGGSSSGTTGTVPRRPTTYNTAANASSKAAVGSGHNTNPTAGAGGRRASASPGVVSASDDNGANGGPAARTHARERAVMALLELILKGERVVPSRRWRQQYVRTNGVGGDVVSVLVEFLDNCSDSRLRHERNKKTGGGGGGGGGGNATARRGVGGGASNGSSQANVDALAMSAGPSSIADMGVLGRRNSVQFQQQMRKSPGVRDGKHSIQTLDLRALKIGDEAFVRLMDSVAEDPLLQCVMLPGNCLTAEGLKGCLAHFRERFGEPNKGGGAAGGGGGGGAAHPASLSQLQLLSLTDNPIDSEGAGVLEHLIPYFSKLVQIEIGQGQAAVLFSGADAIDESEGEYLSTANINSLLRMVKNSPSLESLLLKGTGRYHNKTGFTARGLALFADRVIGHSKLHQLYLQNCYTTLPDADGGLTHTFFARSAANQQHQRHHHHNNHNSSSGQLDGSASNANNSSLGAPSATLPPVASEGDVSLSSAGATEEEIILAPLQSMARALRGPTTVLTTLVLRFPLSDDAMDALGAGLGAATALQNLSLRSCELTAYGLYALAAAMETNTTIRVLDASFQSALVTHPAVLAEGRSSSRRRYSVQNSHRMNSTSGGTMSVGGSGGGTYLQDSAFGEGEGRARGNRERPLQPLIHALQTNRTLEQLLVEAIIITTADVEDLCACIERYHNAVLSAVVYTDFGLDALNMRLGNLLESNAMYACDQSAVNHNGGTECDSPSASRARQTPHSAMNNGGGGFSGGWGWGDDATSVESTPRRPPIPQQPAGEAGGGKAPPTAATPKRPSGTATMSAADAVAGFTTALADYTAFSSPASPPPQDVTNIRSPSHGQAPSARVSNERAGSIGQGNNNNNGLSAYRRSNPREAFHSTHKYLDADGDDSTTGGGGGTGDWANALDDSRTGSQDMSGGGRGTLADSLRRRDVEEHQKQQRSGGGGQPSSLHVQSQPLFSPASAGSYSAEEAAANFAEEAAYYNARGIAESSRRGRRDRLLDGGGVGGDDSEYSPRENDSLMNDRSGGDYDGGLRLDDIDVREGTSGTNSRVRSRGGGGGGGGGGGTSTGRYGTVDHSSSSPGGEETLAFDSQSHRF